jgi:hypothetical protein
MPKGTVFTNSRSLAGARGQELEGAVFTNSSLPTTSIALGSSTMRGDERSRTARTACASTRMWQKCGKILQRERLHPRFD